MDWSLALLILVILFILWVLYGATRPRKVYTLQSAVSPAIVYPENNPHVFRDSLGCATGFIVLVLACLFGLAYLLVGLV